jgi:hypothetical protein
MTSHDTLLLREKEQDRAGQLARRLTLKHMEAIAKDTRLPAEIACTYGITAEVVISYQAKRPPSGAARSGAEAERCNSLLSLNPKDFFIERKIADTLRTLQGLRPTPWK